LAQALVEWAFLEVRAGDQTATFQGLTEAYDLLKQLVKSHPKELRYRNIFGRAADQLGDWHFDVKQDFNSADPCYHEALETFRRLAEELPDDHDIQFSYATAWSRVADLHKARGEKIEALAASEKELAITQLLEAAAPDNVHTLWRSSIAYDHVSRDSMALRNHARALEVLRRVFDMRMPILDTDPENRRYHNQAILCIRRLGKVYQDLGDYGKAADAYEAGLKRLTNFAARTGDHTLDNDIAAIRLELDKCRLKVATPK
jgi:tetratricopeptide (TPR) repeat protein